MAMKRDKLSWQEARVRKALRTIENAKHRVASDTYFIAAHLDEFRDEWRWRVTEELEDLARTVEREVRRIRPDRGTKVVHQVADVSLLLQRGEE